MIDFIWRLLKVAYLSDHMSHLNNVKVVIVLTQFIIFTKVRGYRKFRRIGRCSAQLLFSSNRYLAELTFRQMNISPCTTLQNNCLTRRNFRIYHTSSKFMYLKEATAFNRSVHSVQSVSVKERKKSAKKNIRQNLHLAKAFP